MTSGITTLLFTDIEASTRLWEREGERMSRALAQHDSLSRSAVERHNGVVVKMTGDGMYAAFGDPVDAINATVALQLALKDPSATGGLELRLRYGVHLGVVERRDEDLFGNPVNRAARIMKAAHGGQILLSQAVVDYVRGRLPSSISLRDLGAVRLRDLATSEHLYQVLHPELRQNFPALRSLEATPNNLPQQVTSFIGRERELAEAKALLERTRLLTLHGMGGLGKTRLSLQIAADELEKYPDGVWFVDLAPIKDPSLVPNAAAQVLGVHEEPGKALVQTLCGHVKDHKALFVLDNCEHLVAASAGLADALLVHAPQVRIVATSREALRIRGEQTYPVLPLAVPDRNADADSLLRSDAVQLLVERARLQKPTFALTEREAPAVAELCARLEGIPLALELAAARLRSLSVEEINKRLHDRFKLLTGGSRVALERQQTLRALVSWSYDLLNEHEQIVLDRLSVFVGGFDLDAAEAVCGADPIAPEDVLDLLTSLVEKSLVMVKQEEGWSRYGMLETIREFAREHLIELGDEKGRYGLHETVRDFAHEKLIGRDDLAATAARHCDYYLTLAKTARAKMEGPEQAEWMRRLEVELDNVRAGIALALASKVDPVLAIKFEVALMRFRILRGYSTEGRANIRMSLPLAGVTVPNEARGHALYVGGALAINQGDAAEAAKMLTECLAIRRSLGDPKRLAATLSTLSTFYLQQGETTTARDCEVEALGLFRQLGNRIGEGIGLSNLGEISIQLGAYGDASDHFEQSLAIARSISYQELEGECERKLGELALRAGDLPKARARFLRSLQVCRDAEDKRNEAMTLWCLGKVEAASGDHGSARDRLAEALQALNAFEMNSETLACLEDYAQVLLVIGGTRNAVELQACAAAMRQALALPRSPLEEAKWQSSIQTGRATLGEAMFEAAWSAGRSFTLDEAISHALSTAPAVTA